MTDSGKGTRPPRLATSVVVMVVAVLVGSCSWAAPEPSKEVARLHISRPDCPAFPIAGLPQASEQFGSAAMGRVEKVAPPKTHVPLPSGPPESVRITLERTSCYGQCPAYTVVLKGDGTALYSGGRFALVTGEYEYKVDPKAVSCLVDAFKNADFWSLSNEYVAQITDGPTSVLTLQIGGQSKTIKDYLGRAVGMPPLVSSLEAAVDSVAGSKSWTRGDGDTLPKLRQAGLDLRSNKAAELLANAAVVSSIPVVVSLVEAGLPVGGSVESPYDGVPDGPLTIEAASGRKDISLVRMLIQRGALSTPGATELALHRAAAVADPAMVQELLKSKPDVNQRDRFGRTALLDTGGFGTLSDSPKNEEAVVRLLLAAGADPRIADNEGFAPLHRVSDVGVARLLVQGGAPLDVESSQGRPVFSNYSEEVVAYLITAGAKIDGRSPSGETLSERAKHHGWRKVLVALRTRSRR